MSDLILTDIVDVDDKRIFRHTQNVAPILSDNYEMRKHDGWNGGGKDMKLAARIPLAVWLEWEKLGITEDQILLRKAIELHQEYKTTTKKLI